jgi:hypothetical protein
MIAGELISLLCCQGVVLPSAAAVLHSAVFQTATPGGVPVWVSVCWLAWHFLFVCSSKGCCVAGIAVAASAPTHANGATKPKSMTVAVGQPVGMSETHTLSCDQLSTCFMCLLRFTGSSRSQYRHPGQQVLRAYGWWLLIPNRQQHLSNSSTEQLVLTEAIYSTPCSWLHNPQSCSGLAIQGN